jgi:signal transduction histidine kinase/CheY-like chemotaxis protein/HAMP domain-containing protein
VAAKVLEQPMTDVDHQQSRLDRAALEQLLAGLIAVRGGDFSKRLAPTGDPLVDEIADVFNGMADQLDQFTDEVTRVAREVGTEGKLGGQAHVPGVSGTWEDLTDSVNAMAGNLTAQVRNIAQVATAVANGDLTQQIGVEAQGEILELKTTLNTMVDQLSSFAAEVTRVAHEVGRDGKLGGQARVEGVSGTWKRLTESVNELSGTLTRQVRAMSGVTSAVASGDLTRTISVEAEGEVAELKDNVNAMVRSLRETVQALRDQDWLKSNLASIGSMLQGHRDLEVVAELIMDELAPLVGAQHGTFFLTEEIGGDARLRLIAGYGLRADKNAPIQYRIGQSLIGQVAKSKRPIVVDEIPPGYIKISSGLGEAAPANLAVLPVMFEDQVLGVVELASFRKFTPIQIDFLEQLTETLGVSVNAIVANARTDDLLQQSQRLTAELQARSTELQSRSEELQLSNADLEDKAALLAAQKRDIEAKNAEISRAREEIEERARQLALASQYKSQFLANMSHELRTPLNSMLILARLLAQNPSRNLTSKQVEYANVIHSAGSDLLQLINDILDLSKVEAGRLDVYQERFLLSALVEDLRATFGPLTTEKGLEFTVSVDPSAPAEMTTDRQRLRQVLGNLLSNAVKFTDKGHVELRVLAAEPAQADGDGDGDGDGSMLAFSVTDTGIGIAPENLAVIFGAFQQGDGTLSRRYGGTGLGLSIASEVSTLLGGRITADSDLGRGSTFTLYVPATLPEVPATGEADLLAGIPAGSPAGAVSAAGGTVAGVAPATDRRNEPSGHPDGPATGTGNAAGKGPESGSGTGPGDGPRWEDVDDLAGLDSLATDIAGLGQPGDAGADSPAARSGLPGSGDWLTSGPVGQAVATVAHRARMTGAYIAAMASAAAPGDLSAAESGTAGTSVLVFEGASGGMLTLLAHSAVSDLAETGGTAAVSTATTLPQAIAMLSAERFRCVVVDLTQPAALQFLERVQENPDLRDLTVLAHSAEAPDGGAAKRLSLLRASHQRLELLPSLDELRERIALHLSGGRADEAQAPTLTPADETVAPETEAAVPGEAPADAEAARRALQGKRVLVIDDDTRNVFAISSTLELHGMHVTHATDGRQGIEALIAAPETDVILMDIMMPGMDGYAAMTVIRQMPQFAALPIIAVTARAMLSDRHKSLAAGASDYVTKPVDTEELLDCIERWLAES